MSGALTFNDNEERDLRARAEELQTRVEQLGRFL